MGLIITAIAMVVGATVAVVVDRNIQYKKRLAKKAETQEQITEAVKEEVVEEEESSSPNSFMDRMTSLRKRLTGNKQEVARKFQVWAENNIEDVELKAWLMGLSPEAASALAEQLADFCSNLGFELPWLLENSLDKDPEIEKEAIVVVTLYCQSCRNAAQSYTDFELFKLLQKIEQAPFARQRQDLSRRLFAELVKREMAPSVPAELFLASEKERQEHMTKAIQQATRADRELFKTVLREVMVAETSSTTAESSKVQSESTEEQQTGESEEKKRPFFGGGSRAKQKKSTPASSSEAESSSADRPTATDMPPAAEPSAS